MSAIPIWVVVHLHLLGDLASMQLASLTPLSLYVAFNVKWLLCDFSNTNTLAQTQTHTHTHTLTHPLAVSVHFLSVISRRIYFENSLWNTILTYLSAASWVYIVRSFTSLLLAWNEFKRNGKFQPRIHFLKQEIFVCKKRQCFIEM